MDDQKVGGNDLSLVKVLFMMNTNMFFISGILLAELFKLSSFRLDMSRDYIKLKLLILEQDLLKPNYFLLFLLWSLRLVYCWMEEQKVIAFSCICLVGKLYHMESREILNNYIANK